jgi:hypothetical protein
MLIFSMLQNSNNYKGRGFYYVCAYKIRQLHKVDKHRKTEEEVQKHNISLAKMGFRAPLKHLWLIKHWFSASILVVKIATLFPATDKKKQTQVNDPNTSKPSPTLIRNFKACWHPILTQL